MDVLYFLKDRTRLIRQYYECAAQPFNEIMRKIDAEEEDEMFKGSDDLSCFMLPSIDASRDKLMEVIDQVEHLCEWLEENVNGQPYPEPVENRGRMTKRGSVALYDMHLESI